MILSPRPLLSQDLDYILEKTYLLWENLRNKRIFITGGTGFIGSWLLESLLRANKKLQLHAEAVILTRHPEQFAKKYPHLFAEDCFIFHEGRMEDFTFPAGEFFCMIHAATETAHNLYSECNPQLQYNSIIQGTKQCLEFARRANVQKFLFISSGAVYGKQPSNLSQIIEDHAWPSMSIVNNRTAYALGKRNAEMICGEYAEKYHLDITIARCFALVGPNLPLDAQFAIGNFIKNALFQEPIHIKSDGSSYRSYLYAADVTIWLWIILFQGKTMRPYNVGAEEPITIAELAQLIARCSDTDLKIHIDQKSSGLPPERYVPDISRARNELGLTVKKNLAAAIQDTMDWYRA